MDGRTDGQTDRLKYVQMCTEYYSIKKWRWVGNEMDCYTNPRFSSFNILQLTFTVTILFSPTLLHPLKEKKGELKISATFETSVQSTVLYWQRSKWRHGEWWYSPLFEGFLTSAGGVGFHLKFRKMHTQFWLKFSRFLSFQNPTRYFQWGSQTLC